jgi:tetratricopeptide (TPR) repeat protein
VREWDTEKSILSYLCEFLRALGKGKTADAVNGSAPVTDIYVPLSSDLSGSAVVMFIDDVQKASSSVSLLISMLSDAARYSESSKLVMMSRSVPPFFSKTSLGNLSVELAGLDREAAWEMAQGSKIPDAAQAVSESHGHPLLLNLMLRSGVGAAKGDVSGFIESEVYSALTHDEKSILELLSVFRHPVAVDAIPASSLQALEGLRRKALVVEQSDGLSTHDLLKEFFSSRLSGEALSNLRRRAGTYCEEHSPVEWKLEALFQYVEGKEWEGAKRVALANASELIREFPNETLGLASRIPQGTGQRREDGELLYLRGQLNEALRREEAAITDYQESIGYLDGEQDTQMRASVLEAMAKLQSQVERWSESFLAHEKALRLYEKAGDKEGQVREWMNLGGAHRRRRDFARAKESYNKALTLATQEENRSSQAACLNNLGLLDWDEGRLREAEVRLKESVRLSHAVKDHLGEAHGLENLAELFRLQSRIVEMNTLLLESADAFRRAEEFEDFKRLQAQCAESLGDQGKFADGIEMCRNALETPELRRRRGLFQKGPRFDKGDTLLSLALIDLLRRSGDLKGAAKEVSRYSSMAESIGDSSILAKGKLEAALISEDSGDLGSAVSALEKAEGMLRSAGDSEGLIAVHMRLGIVQEKLGLEGPAAEHYSEAARHAELVGNRRALAVALENLRSVKKNGAQI